MPVFISSPRGSVRVRVKVMVRTPRRRSVRVRIPSRSGELSSGVFSVGGLSPGELSPGGYLLESCNSDRHFYYYRGWPQK